MPARDRRPASSDDERQRRMKIVVIGGTGLIGSKTVTRLRTRGHEVVAASPSTGIDTVTGEGLAEALTGADVVVDVANSPSFDDQAVMDFFETSGHNLATAEIAAGVGHHVGLSVVGTERLQRPAAISGASWPRRRGSRLPGSPIRSSARRSSSSSSAASSSRARSGRRSACPQPPCSRSVPTTWPASWPISPSSRR